MLCLNHRTRRAQIIAASLAISLFGLYSVFHINPDSSLRVKFPKTPWSSSHEVAIAFKSPSALTTYPSNNSTRTSPWCTPEECGVGRWEPRRPPFLDVQEFREAFANRKGVGWKGCKPHSDPSLLSLKEDERQLLSEMRLMQVMNWTWVPSSGELKKWDPEAFVVRLLRSPGGIILVGDSITREHAQTLTFLLDRAGIPLERNPPTYVLSNRDNVVVHFLQSGDPTTERLRLLAGVPQSRLQRPIITLMEDDMLISTHDIKIIVGRLGANNEDDWKDPSRKVDGWTDVVRDMTRRRAGESVNGVSQDSLLLINTGSHWTRSVLSMFPERSSSTDEQARVKAAFRQMVTIVMNRLNPTPFLSVFYRSSSPPHPFCYNADTPYRSATAAHLSEQDIVEQLVASLGPSATEEEKRIRRRWDWDLFKPQNDIWRRAVVRVNAARAEQERLWIPKKIPAPPKAVGKLEGGAVGGKKKKLKPVPRSLKGDDEKQRSLGAKWVYLDFWDLNLQRPDAHAESDDDGTDCLHWCMPSVLDEWTFHLYHYLFLGSPAPTPEVTSSAL